MTFTLVLIKKTQVPQSLDPQHDCTVRRSDLMPPHIPKKHLIISSLFFSSPSIPPLSICVIFILVLFKFASPYRFLHERGRTIPCLMLLLLMTGLYFQINGVCLAFLRARPTLLIFLALMNYTRWVQHVEQAQVYSIYYSSTLILPVK